MNIKRFVDVGLHTHTEFTAALYCWLEMFSERSNGKSTRLDMFLEGYTGAEMFPAGPVGADSFLGELPPRCNCMGAIAK